jgi:hypothetical protein
MLAQDAHAQPEKDSAEPSRARLGRDARASTDLPALYQPSVPFQPAWTAPDQCSRARHAARSAWFHARATLATARPSSRTGCVAPVWPCRGSTEGSRRDEARQRATVCSGMHTGRESCIASHLSVPYSVKHGRHRDHGAPHVPSCDKLAAEEERVTDGPENQHDDRRKREPGRPGRT